jgi:hypothetical protein
MYFFKKGFIYKFIFLLLLLVLFFSFSKKDIFGQTTVCDINPATGTCEMVSESCYPSQIPFDCSGLSPSFCQGVRNCINNFYTCNWTGSSCIVSSSSCAFGYDVPSPSACEEATSELACVNVGEGICVDLPGPPTSTPPPPDYVRWCCNSGTGSCIFVNSGESCSDGSSPVTRTQCESSCTGTYPTATVSIIERSARSPFGDCCPPDQDNCAYIDTALGCIPFGSMTALTGFFLQWGLGVGGGVAFLLIIYSAFIITTSAGNPDRMKSGREILTAAIAGLMLIIFSVFILEFIGVRIFRIPGF